jgi:hypothetical protein
MKHIGQGKAGPWPLRALHRGARPRPLDFPNSREGALSGQCFFFEAAGRKTRQIAAERWLDFFDNGSDAAANWRRAPAAYSVGPQ